MEKLKQDAVFGKGENKEASGGKRRRRDYSLISNRQREKAKSGGALQAEDGTFGRVNRTLKNKREKQSEKDRKRGGTFDKTSRNDEAQGLNIRNKNQRGRSMIEMLGVLAVIGVLSVGGLAGYNRAMQKVRVNRFIEEFNLVRAEADQFLMTMEKSKENALGFSAVNTQNLQEAVSVFGAKLSQFIFRDFTTIDYQFLFSNIPSDLCREMMGLDMDEYCCVGNGQGSYYKPRSKGGYDFCTSTDPVPIVAVICGSWCSDPSLILE